MYAFPDCGNLQDQKDAKQTIKCFSILIKSYKGLFKSKELTEKDLNLKIKNDEEEFKAFKVESAKNILVL